MSLKILHTVGLYHPAWGGNEIQAKMISEHIVKSGEQVYVFTSDATNLYEIHDHSRKIIRCAKKEIINGVSVRRFKSFYNIQSFVNRRMDQIRGGYRLKSLLVGDADEMWRHGPFLPGMLWAIAWLRPDIMLSINTYFMSTYFCYLAKKMFRIPWVISPSTHVTQEWYFSDLNIRMLNAADHIVTSTEFERKFIAERINDTAKISVIGQGLEPEKFLETDGKAYRTKLGIGDNPVVFYVGRRDLRKGVATLLEAMDQVWDAYSRAKLIIAGNNFSNNETAIQGVKDRISPRKRENLIEIRNFSDEEKYEIFNAGDIFVMPSSIDSFGFVYLEAWICGKPVIACRNMPQGTFMEEGRDSLLVDYENAQQVSTAIIKLIENKELRKRLGENGKRKVLEQYTWDKIANNYHELYQRVLAKK
ncbi:MAG: glycosyltransferase family 4 protein [Candidatus Omnitrophica bacterium]|nr:glycosyltransferase family 4 protein [Candidatus Omnitrophota bacterium]